MARVHILLFTFIYLIQLCASASFVKTTKNFDCPFGRKCIHKCCPIGEHLLKKTCIKYRSTVDFSGLIVYDDHKQDTGRRVQDEFVILGGKLVDDFQTDEAYTSGRVGYIPYVMESGELTLEMPNVYRRWIQMPNDKFCVEYMITTSGGLTIEPKFMLLESPEKPSQPTSYAGKKYYLSAASLVSCVFLLLVLVVYILLPELQNLGGQILMSYVASLFTAFLMLAVIQLGLYPTIGCIILTFVLYFSFLASFCWMSVMSYDIWWTFRGYAKARPIHRRGERFKFLMYCVCAWGVPLLMSVFLVVVTTTDMRSKPWFITPQIPKKGCFLSGEAELLYLYIPMLILIVCNWLFYLMTAFNIWRLSRGTAVLDTAAAGTPSAHRSQRHRLMVYLKLSVVMGLSWVFEIISYMWPNFQGWHVTDFYNMFIGIAIFVIFVCKRKIYRKLCKRYLSLRGKRQYEPGSSKSYSSNSSSSGQETVELRVCGNPKGNGYSACSQGDNGLKS